MTRLSVTNVPAPSATNWVETDLKAVRHNVGVIGRRVAPASVAAVVKADGYGHGAVTISRAALEAGASQLCVFTIPEAEQLREAGIEAPILCLGPVLEGDPEVAAGLNVAVVVDSAETAQRLAAAARTSGTLFRVHINLDSGMQRYGRPYEEADSLARAISAHHELVLEAVFTHFPDATNPDQDATLGAFGRFQETADRLGVPIRHTSASAAAFGLPQTGLSFIRAGIALYGIDPAPHMSDTGADELRPVLSWRARLLTVRELNAGESVSYGGLWTADRDSRIGVIGAGYADGLRRASSPGGFALIRGRRAPYRGAICMDSAMIDVTEIPEAAPGDVVTIIGDDGESMIPAWDLARLVDTIPYEIFTSISSRVPRVVIDAPD